MRELQSSVQESRTSGGACAVRILGNYTFAYEHESHGFSCFPRSYRSVFWQRMQVKNSSTSFMSLNFTPCSCIVCLLHSVHQCLMSSQAWSVSIDTFLVNVSAGTAGNFILQKLHVFKSLSYSVLTEHPTMNAISNRVVFIFYSHLTPRCSKSVSLTEAGTFYTDILFSLLGHLP